MFSQKTASKEPREEDAGTASGGVWSSLGDKKSRREPGARGREEGAGKISGRSQAGRKKGENDNEERINQEKSREGPGPRPALLREALTGRRSRGARAP